MKSEPDKKGCKSSITSTLVFLDLVYLNLFKIKFPTRSNYTELNISGHKIFDHEDFFYLH